ncbi:MFS transporter, partial [Actinotalea sp. C106]|uniref:MFS transporter n=1 Tax=Actinotalea sp. C106 TaxID=2908644 RepID=UPI0035AC1F4D
MSVLSDLRVVAVHRDFRKLFAVRLVSQCGDGMFQIGLATLFFFSPERMATATDVAVAFAVLLLPFTVVGPFAGPLLDRWRRRQVLLLGNAVRVVLALLLAWLLVTVGVGPAVYVLALVTLGVNRFLLAALSASLPRVVPREQLLIANALTPTLGAVSAVVGAGLGLLSGWLIPAGRGEDGVVLV